ncbi:MAG: hydroxyphenylacetyl-CoA thioesterase PaaI [Proteobacteria bacterium]|nr:hydroxyphenylacetyl-CoA thioesterase PaaI [Pseudomonadota bacterium]MCH9005176.1 hydroxyphenylacetyl-CoA thioesterase PaaI [Pseudomonadota bacterium]
MDELETARQCGEVMWEKDKASQALGISVDIPAAGAAVAKMRVRDDMVNGLDVCHGGLIAALADTAFAFACNAYDQVTVAASVQIEFLRPALLGDELVASAREDHRGRKNGYYTVEVRNQGSDLVALFHGRSVGTGKPLISG